VWAGASLVPSIYGYTNAYETGSIKIWKTRMHKIFVDMRIIFTVHRPYILHIVWSGGVVVRAFDLRCRLPVVPLSGNELIRKLFTHTHTHTHVSL